MKYIALFFTMVFCFTSASLANNWQHVATYEGVELYSMEHNEQGLLPFKAVRESEFPIESFVKLLIDYEHKSKWAPKLKNVKLHKELGANKYIFSEYYTTPWPFYDREFLLQGEIKKVGSKVIFEGIEIPDDSFKDNDHVKANVRVLTVTLTPNKSGTHIEFEFIGDMGGAIPHFVSNIIQKKWPVRFIQAMEKTIKEGDVRNTKAYNSFVAN
ncbi:hypothetical protein M899_0889 [Bacteriovorax sp. BSW11_IV]|uniref:hypothetical protein n=1 Tax=Bacteriovorax sp. BSW11_IV TaxID=1353529 RepID=UPI000389E439|nr:hypothetical protein [Bacteriovorax sp. BSW11_IV]EQC42937.1 hypothetical protein M899_0889 [Bacteriovorax sp. BSW11_IV]